MTYGFCLTTLLPVGILYVFKCQRTSIAINSARFDDIFTIKFVMKLDVYRHADTPTRRHADTPTRRHADTPTRRHADTPTRRHAVTPSRHHADTPSRRHAVQELRGRNDAIAHRCVWRKNKPHTQVSVNVRRSHTPMATPAYVQHGHT